MEDFGRNWVYQELGLRPVINAQGNKTVLGGSTLSPKVREAIEEANRHFVVMEELLEKSGNYIADVLGTESAYVTSGCAAALALSAAACMAGNDPEKIVRLPDTTGMKDEILIQKKQRYAYDRNYTVTGAKLLEVGDENGCTGEQLEAAIGPQTAAVAYLIQPDWDSSVVSLEDAVEIAHSHGVPVIGDSASQIYPLDYFRRNAQVPDLACFGAKYLSAPHATGFVCGKKDLVDAVVAQGFIAFQTHGQRAIGRPMKIDRQNIIAVVASLKAWFTMNHEDRLLENERRLSTMQTKLQGIPNVEATVAQSKQFWGFTLYVGLDSKALGKNAQQVAAELDQGNPRIMVETEDEEKITVIPHGLHEGEEDIVVDRLREVLS